MNTSRPPATLERKAECVLEETGCLRVPVPVDLVAGSLGLRVELGNLTDQVSGVLVVTNGRGVIACNMAHAPVRQRFTVAHEIAHYVLHVSSEESKLFIDRSVAFNRDHRSSGGNDQEEVQANAFAAALLMPANLVREEVTRLSLDLDDEDDVGRLARLFNVSVAAMSFRLINLGLLR